MHRIQLVTTTASPNGRLETAVRPEGAPKGIPTEMPAEHPLARSRYIPDAPMRAKTGDGKIIRGRAIALETGDPVPFARVEYWLNTTPDVGGIGEQSLDNRGTVIADDKGQFLFETHPPQRACPETPPHVHMRISAEERDPFYHRLVTSNAPSTEDITIILRRS